VCQKLLDLAKAFKRHKQKYTLASLFWITWYTRMTVKQSH